MREEPTKQQLEAAYPHIFGLSDETINDMAPGRDPNKIREHTARFCYEMQKHMSWPNALAQARTYQKGDRHAAQNHPHELPEKANPGRKNGPAAPR